MGSAVCKSATVVNLDSMQNQQKFLKFTEEEKKAIRKVWKKAVEKQISLELIISVITQKPNFAVFFDTTFTTAEELRACPRIQGHAAKIVGFIQNIVDGLDNIAVDEIRKMLFGVGIIHFTRNINFDTANYLLFKRILMEKICEDVDKITHDAWFKLLRLMMAEMKAGFFNEVLKHGTTKHDDEEEN